MDEIMEGRMTPHLLGQAGVRPEPVRRSDVSQSKADASPAQTFTNELLEVLEHWREGIDPDPVTQYAKGAATEMSYVVGKLDEMLRYTGVKS